MISRKRLYRVSANYATTQGDPVVVDRLVFGSHLPLPDVGCVVPQGESWREPPLVVLDDKVVVNM